MARSLGGGGAFLVWYDAESGELTTLDGRETAPLAADPRQFQDDAGEPLGFFDAVVGGLSVGTPGTPKLMEEAHRRWGRANWPGLFDEAIALAEDGFTVSPRLAELVAGDSERLQRFPDTAGYFFPEGTAIAAGDRLTNPDYAETLRLIAEGGSRAFYTGVIAEEIVATVRGAEGNPGRLSTADLALYQVKERPAVCAAYRAHEVCGMGPPSSGALTVGQILGMLDSYDLATLGPDSAEAWRLIGDASRLAFADRGRYMADTDFVPVPVAGLVAPDYLASRAELLAGDDALPEVAPGAPEWDHAMRLADDESIEFPSTSHISIVDADGNALSMTTTIENGFGSRLMAAGFLLNNELTDFSFLPKDAEGRPVANRVEAGKRPRSSMAPMIVLDGDGRFVLAAGSPGGSRIIGYVAQTLFEVLYRGKDVQAAVDAPHVVNRNDVCTEVEAPSEGQADQVKALVEALKARGHGVKVRDLNSGLHALRRVEGGYQGGADPRREGMLYGDGHPPPADPADDLPKTTQP